MLDWGFSSDVYVNTAPDPDIAVNSNVPFYFIEPTAEGQVAFTIGAEQGSTLPQSLSLRFNASQGLQYRGFRIEGAGAYSAGCHVVNGAGTCQLGLAAGLSTVRAVFMLQPGAAQDYPFSLAVNSANRELNYQNNNLTVSVTGIKPVFTATAVIKGKGQVLPSSQQIPLGEAARFAFIPDHGYRLEEFAGCNASLINGQLYTGDILADCELVVSFVPIVFPVEAVVAPENGKVDCNLTEAVFGSSITCLATPAKGFKFVGWKNSQCQGQARSCALVVDGAINLQPEFAPITSKRKPLPLWLFAKP